MRIIRARKRNTKSPKSQRKTGIAGLQMGLDLKRNRRLRVRKMIGVVECVTTIQGPNHQHHACRQGEQQGE